MQLINVDACACLHSDCSVSFQVINNACATQAIVSVLLNCTHPDMLLGETLTEFREFSLSFDAAVSPCSSLFVLVVVKPDYGQPFNLVFSITYFQEIVVFLKLERSLHILI